MNQLLLRLIAARFNVQKPQMLSGHKRNVVGSRRFLDHQHHVLVLEAVYIYIYIHIIPSSYY